MTEYRGPHGLTKGGELRLCRLLKIRDRIAEIEVERQALMRERSSLAVDARLDDPPTPVELLADFAGVTPAAILIQLRAEETSRGLERGALGRKATQRV